ncbi:MAG: proteasome assembly chaperone family protein [Acidimicrobiales bacterium]
MALYELHDRPSLNTPALVMVLEGWIDSGHAAAGAAQTLLSELDTFPVATFDADALLDHRARRPIMHLVDGVNTALSWPGIEMRGGTDQEGNDVLLLLGAEPDHQWRAFTDEALGLAQEFDARMVVGLGAYPATVPHTRPVTLSVTATTPELASVSGLLRGTLDVPAGVQAVIERRCDELDLPAIGLWAQIPHYVSGDGSPYPAGSLALIRQLERSAGLSLPTGDLIESADATRGRIDEAMSDNPDHLALLHSLEARHDELVQAAPTSALPSADELAEEVEQFLRDQGPAD